LTRLPGGEERARSVRRIFGAIAGRYDFLNHALSANLDRRWRAACVREVGRRLRAPSPLILDVGCGTADLALAVSRLGRVVGCDFSRPMLERGAEKVARAGRAIELLEADALHLPFGDRSFDAVVSAFVLRNLADLDRGLEEMRRVLRPGGVLAVLDFGMPRLPVVSGCYRFYFLRVLPRIGKGVSGVDGAYGYLPRSVEEFPPAEELRERAIRAGLEGVHCRRVSGGITVLLTGSRPLGE